MSKETRWKQRFENLQKAFRLFEEAATADELSRLEQEGLIQRFEYTFELSWKTLKDYLEAQGISATFPRDVIKESFRAGVIDDGETWIEILEKRDTLSHTYDEAKFQQSVEAVQKRFYGAVASLVGRLENKL